MPRTDAEHLEALKARRDELMDALSDPGTISAFGGLPDSNGPLGVRRMEARRQLQSELDGIKQEIRDLEATIDGGDAVYIESRGAY